MDYQYKTLRAFRVALDSGEVDRETVDVYDRGGEMFVHRPHADDDDYDRLFTGYFGGARAVQEVCDLLGLPAPESV